MSSLSDQFAADSAELGGKPAQNKSMSQQFADDSAAAAKATQPFKLVRPSSTLERIATGTTDFVNKGAQLLVHSLPDSVVDSVNQFNNKLADRFPSVIAKVPEGGVDQMVNEREDKYQAQRKAAGSTDFDWARLFGNVLNPTVAIPGAGQVSLLKAAALGGAAAVTTTPTVGEDQNNFWTSQAKLGGLGALGGMGIQLGINAATPFIKAGYQKLSGLLPQTTKAGNDAAEIVNSALQSKNVDPATIAPEILNNFKTEVQKSLDANIKPDTRTLQNYIEAQSLPVPVPILRGQASRDPMAYAKEMNLRGINGVGEPISNVMTLQNRALIDNLDKMGADKGSNIVDAGQKAIDTLKFIDSQARASVSDAYRQFRNATGKSLDVPLQGVAQDYARIAHEYGMSTLPEGVRNQLNSLGLLSGNQMKTFGIEDAEHILKVINKNYDSSNRAQASALDELRRSIQGAITQGTAGDNLGAEAAQLAKNARALAAKRFQMIDAVPAYKAAISDAAPDKFLQKYFWNGNSGEVANMKKMLQAADPDALNAIKQSILRDIKQSALNNQSADNGIFSQAKFNGIVRDQNNSKRISAMFEPHEANLLQRIGNVAENVMLAPKASAVNSSNTASAAANLIQTAAQGGAGTKLLSLLGKANLPVASPVAQSLANKSGKTALADIVNKATSPLAVNDLNYLKYFSNIPSELGGNAAGNLQQKQ